MTFESSKLRADAAGDSFYIIVVTFAVSRGLLLLQYLVGASSLMDAVNPHRG